jgi:glutaminase
VKHSSKAAKEMRTLKSARRVSTRRWKSQKPQAQTPDGERKTPQNQLWQLARDRIRCVSTGQLPPPEFVERLVAEAHKRFKSNSEGRNAQVYPALAAARSTLFGICVAGTNGNIYNAGDAEHEFSIMSVSKPFLFALVCQSLGPEEARQKLGVNSTGLPFDSVCAIERSYDGRTNPMVNSGAIATTSLAPGRNTAEKWRFIHEGISRFAGRNLSLNEEVFKSASATNHRNQSIARFLKSRDCLHFDPGKTTELYTRQCALNVSANDLAVMGATLADGGVNPLTRMRVVDTAVCRYALAVMTTAGLYETSGDWLYDIGLPGKSGIGGGIVAVCPGKGGLGTFAPPLDKAGNSVKGQLVARFLSERLGLNLFASEAAVRVGGKNNLKLTKPVRAFQRVQSRLIVPVNQSGRREYHLPLSAK